MPNVKYTDSATFRCLENLKEGSLDISLIHTGKEHCTPGHICSIPRDEFFILYWMVPDFILPAVRPGVLLPDKCLSFIRMSQLHMVQMKLIHGPMPG